MFLDRGMYVFLSALLCPQKDQAWFLSASHLEGLMWIVLFWSSTKSCYSRQDVFLLLTLWHNSQLCQGLMMPQLLTLMWSGFGYPSSWSVKCFIWLLWVSIFCYFFLKCMIGNWLWSTSLNHLPSEISTSCQVLAESWRKVLPCPSLLDIIWFEGEV